MLYDHKTKEVNQVVDETSHKKYKEVDVLLIIKVQIHSISNVL